MSKMDRQDRLRAITKEILGMGLRAQYNQDGAENQIQIFGFGKIQDMDNPREIVDTLNKIIKTTPQYRTVCDKLEKLQVAVARYRAYFELDHIQKTGKEIQVPLP